MVETDMVLESFYDGEPEIINQQIPDPKYVINVSRLLHLFDKIIVLFSGGKDSLDCILYLLKLGVPKDKFEIWHQSVDGRKSDGAYIENHVFPYFDYPVTESYCRKVCEYLELDFYVQWRIGGLHEEFTRIERFTQPAMWENPDGTIGKSKTSKNLKFKITRMLFPQIGSIQNGRYCTPKGKIDVFRTVITNSPRFSGIKTLIVSGERAEESQTRANYSTFEKERGLHNSKREIYRWRPVHSWLEQKVWDFIKEEKIRPHPAYEIFICE